MNIFKAYTGNAMLNNAIMIVLSLSGKNSIEELTPQLLQELIKKKDLTSDNKRFKSYTMLFTRNGPLFNDELGDMLYKGLLQKIANNIETEGKLQCEISGLKFNTTFEDLFIEMLREIKYADVKFKMQEEKAKTKKNYKEKTPEQIIKEKEKILSEKDLSINRMWFPLIGGLGSDAQALPQAKFNYNVHPLCILLMQFMPYGAVLYKGGALVVDSCNHDFSFEYIQRNVKDVQERYESVSNTQSIENIKPDTSHYIIQALDIIQYKTFFYNEYTDLNLWSFSNAGTGASCTIERLPNQTLKDLTLFYQNGTTQKDLFLLLQSKYGINFIEYLTDKKDYYGLYPAKGWEGVEVGFYDLYQNTIGNSTKIQHAKFIAGLIKDSDKLPKEFEKLIKKTDAYNDKNYMSVVDKVIVDAALKNRWDISNHLLVLDNVDEFPINSNMYQIYKMVHYYLQKEIYITDLPQVEISDNTASNILGFITSCIDNHNKDIKNLFVNEDSSRVANLKRVLTNNSKDTDIQLVLNILYNQNYTLRVWGLLDLLKVYYANTNNHNTLSYNLNSLKTNSFDTKPIIIFCDKYFNYYCGKYMGEDSLPLDKFKNHVLKPMPRIQSDFYKWFEQRKEKLEEANIDITDIDYITQDGENKLDISLFTTTFELTKHYFNKL